MGRGRAKAKQTKVARDLKYSSGNTDLTALQRELHSGSPGWGIVATSPPAPTRTAVDDDEPDYSDRYAVDDAGDDDEHDKGPAAATG